MTIRGLLDYASKEPNYEEFKKSIRNLAKSDEYQEVYREVYGYDNTSGLPQDLQMSNPKSSRKYIIKRDFPFLSHYDVLEKSLPDGLVVKLLKDTARLITRHIDIIGSMTNKKME